jgi:hypothetical protein
VLFSAFRLEQGEYVNPDLWKLKKLEDERPTEFGVRRFRTPQLGEWIDIPDLTAKVLVTYSA